MCLYISASVSVEVHTSLCGYKVHFVSVCVCVCVCLCVRERECVCRGGSVDVYQIKILRLSQLTGSEKE